MSRSQSCHDAGMPCTRTAVIGPFPAIDWPVSSRKAIASKDILIHFLIGFTQSRPMQIDVCKICGSEVCGSKVRFGKVPAFSFYFNFVFCMFIFTAPWISDFSAAPSIASSSWKSTARTVLLSSRVLKRFFGSFI